MHILSGWVFCTAGICIVTLLGPAAAAPKDPSSGSLSKHVLGDILFVASSILWAFSTVLVKMELTQDEIRYATQQQQQAILADAPAGSPENQTLLNSNSQQGGGGSAQNDYRATGGNNGSNAAAAQQQDGDHGEQQFTAANYPHMLLWGYIAFVGSVCMLPLLFLDKNADGTRGIVIPVTGLQICLLAWNCLFGVLWHSVL